MRLLSIFFAYILIASATSIIKPAQSQSLLGQQQHQQDPTIRCHSEGVECGVGIDSSTFIHIHPQRSSTHSSTLPFSDFPCVEQPAIIRPTSLSGRPCIYRPDIDDELPSDGVPLCAMNNEVCACALSEDNRFN
jgi:hypothetical protein